MPVGLAPDRHRWIARKLAVSRDDFRLNVEVWYPVATNAINANAPNPMKRGGGIEVTLHGDAMRGKAARPRQQ